MIKDYKSFNEQIHLFDKGSFKYLKSTAPVGQGPNVMTMRGDLNKALERILTEMFRT